MYEAIVIGVSAGGLAALTAIIPELPGNYQLSVLIVQHQVADASDFLSEYLNEKSSITVQEAIPGEKVLPGNVYIGPPNYHLLVEKNRRISLSVDSKVNYSIPSIDVLFESAADAYQKKLVGVILTGANSDGSQGLKKIKKAGGLTIVQDPVTAEMPEMPKAAINATTVDHILTLRKITQFLKSLSHE